ncbi:hypothetical protein BDR05DRAFT_946555 [Suillus weaverae]|nr:hypothetical protein BDR05DRAFT_946555 [Suillus weaverae]
MVRTMQMARKSQGGLVPYVSLRGSASAVPGIEKMEVCPGFQHNEYCIICCDGSIEEHQLFLLMQQGDHTYSPYMGFYHNDKPILTDFLCINATLDVSLKSQLSSMSVLFIHLNLVNNNAGLGTFKLRYQFLRLISNHTDNNNGDPFIGYPARKKTYIAVQIDNSLISHVTESYLWMFSCGSLINNAKSFSYLQLSVLRHHISATVCFNAVCFQPATASHLLLVFTKLVLVEWLPIHTVFPDMLGNPTNWDSTPMYF